jgi:predicted amidohydrolase
VSREVTVSTVSYNPAFHPGHPGLPGVAARVDRAEGYITRAALAGSDIVVFPEAVVQWGLPEPAAETAEALGGYSQQRVAALARHHRLWIVWPVFLRRDGVLTNSAILFDRAGDVAGIYDKMHPVINEIDGGIAPGTRPGVFDTDFGCIGLCICYDMNFFDTMHGLGQGGAEVVFFSSAYIAGLQLQSWAMREGYYLMSAILGEGGRLVDQTGYVLARAGQESLLTRRINLDRRCIHMDYNELKIDAILQKYGTRVRIEPYWDERRMTVSCEDPDLHIDAVFAEFELETQSDFFCRAEGVRRTALGLPPAAVDPREGETAR